MRLVEMFGRFDLQPFETDEYNTPNQMEIMANPDYWREKKGVVGGVQWMTPTQYIQACEMGFRRQSERRQSEHGLVRGGRNPELVKEYAQAMKQGDIFPMLELDYRNDFFGQEGLHRAMAAEMINVKKVPVFIMKSVPREVEEDAVKLRGFAGGGDEEAVADFMEKFHEVTQDHPFDSSQRIGWDGKSTIELRPISDHIHIAAIQTLAPGERTGSASSLLNDVIEISKRTGVKLRLLPKPFGTTKEKLNKKQLVAWYKRKGFVPASQGEMEFDPDAS